MNRMLRLDCPRCKAEFAVANPAVGSFCPVCNFCNTRFELFISQDKNGQFYLDTGYISNIEVTQIRSPDSSETPLALIPIEEALDQEGNFESGSSKEDGLATPSSEDSQLDLTMAVGQKDDPGANSDVGERSKASSIDFSPLAPSSSEDSTTANESSSSITDDSNLDLTVATGHSDDTAAGSGILERPKTKSIDFSPITPSASEDPESQNGSSSSDTDGPELDLTVATGQSEDTAAESDIGQPAQAKSIDFSPLPPTADEPAESSTGFPAEIGPYQLIDLLGEGGMGSIYLAKQISLDRKVALKVVKSHLLKNESMMVRFTREAFAAAQLIHPNVVQIYDMGNDRGNCYFSMELVEGQALQDLIKNNKKLDPEQAANYVLQAARGLECAHHAGMVHRDIKPANLLVNHEGLVKVADLGLVKVPERDESELDDGDISALSSSKELTQFGSTIGTPYYMAPEQATSSMSVDLRADVYSLGCTFYVLLTGQRPFDGRTVIEVVAKHTSAPLVPPSLIVDRVPEVLSKIIAKMMAKLPEDRYQNMGELIAELENYLGISSAAQFTPAEEDARLMETCADAYNFFPLTRVRTVAPLAILGVSLFVAFNLVFISWKWASGVMIFPLAGFLSYLIIQGVNDNTVLYQLWRELSYRKRGMAVLKWNFAVLLWVIAALMAGVFFHWLAMATIGIIVGAAVYVFIDKPIKKHREPLIAKCERLMKRMRVMGMDESTLQMFVAKYSGNHWEEIFEQLFDYEAKRKVRNELSNTVMGRHKPKFRPWVDVMIDAFQRKVEASEVAQDQVLLQRVEQAGLLEKGITSGEARKQAFQMANAMVDKGAGYGSNMWGKRDDSKNQAIRRQEQLDRINNMMREARSGRHRRSYTLLGRLTPWLDGFFGSFCRALFGSCLVVICLIWANQNNLFESSTRSLIDTDVSIVQQPFEGENQLDGETTPLAIPMFGFLINSFNPLVAGLLMIASSVFVGWRVTACVLPGLMIVMSGQYLRLPEFVSLPHFDFTSICLGGVLFIGGIILSRYVK